MLALTPKLPTKATFSRQLRGDGTVLSPEISRAFAAELDTLACEI